MAKSTRSRSHREASRSQVGVTIKQKEKGVMKIAALEHKAVRR
jgi:hypothetical protein